jgi:CPA2 family monovalent cation:H+ antiporter-2
MHEIRLLINIAVALGVTFVGGVLARRIGLPTIVGYLIAFVGDMETSVSSPS